jgi:hypothetical protein
MMRCAFARFDAPTREIEKSEWAFELAVTTLPRLLSAYRRRCNQKDCRFTIEQILEWADQWHARTGEWPIRSSGDIPGADRLNWDKVDHAFRHGRGSLAAGSSLSRLLAVERGVFNRLDQPPLTESQILAWADEHHGRFPM